MGVLGGWAFSYGRGTPISETGPTVLRIISQKVFLKSFCRGELPYKFVNVSFLITDIKNKLTDLCGNCLLQNDFNKTLCAMK